MKIIKITWAGDYKADISILELQKVNEVLYYNVLINLMHVHV